VPQCPEKKQLNWLFKCFYKAARTFYVFKKKQQCQSQPALTDGKKTMGSTMNKTVDFYYDFGSPAAYLAWTQIGRLCATNDAAINYRPVLLGGIFKETGNATPVAIESKGKWFFEDLNRYAAHYQVLFRKNPFFIINSLAMMRGAIWAKNTGVLERYNKAMFEATWVNGLNTADANVIATVLQHADLDNTSMLQAITGNAIKQQLIAETENAVQNGVFGVPTMVVNNELHFGQDRLDWVARRLHTPVIDSLSPHSP
jgi:2-hydroxychromene-2-carboxylate isomerase